MIERVPHYVLTDQTIVAPGVTYGAAPVLLETQGDLRLIKQPGVSSSIGRGESSYFATRYCIVRVSDVSKDPEPPHFIARGRKPMERWILQKILHAREPGRNWRMALRELRSLLKG